MYISKIQLGRNLPLSDGLSNTYQAHQFIWEFFSGKKNQKRDFIFRLENQERLPLIYTVSERKPETDRPGWFIETKEYCPKIKPGQCFGFIVRVNPVCTKRSEDSGKKHMRHDIIMEAKTHLKASGVPKKDWPLETEIIQDEGVRWLEARAVKHGFSFKPGAIQVYGYQQLSFYKLNTRQEVKISTLEITGQITVTDPALLLELLYRGIGPSKGFGCGMMLVRKI